MWIWVLAQPLLKPWWSPLVHCASVLSLMKYSNNTILLEKANVAPYMHMVETLQMSSLLFLSSLCLKSSKGVSVTSMLLYIQFLIQWLHNMFLGVHQHSLKSSTTEHYSPTCQQPFQKQCYKYKLFLTFKNLWSRWPHTYQEKHRWSISNFKHQSK